MSGKSKEEIAFELVSKLKGVGVWGENNMAGILDMYAQCLEATSGLRSVDGKPSAAQQLAGNSASPAKPAAKAPAPRAAAPAPAARAAAPQQAPAQQPQVRQQQQIVQQAYQQQQQSPTAR